jgi:hypothetical protein
MIEWTWWGLSSSTPSALQALPLALLALLGLQILAPVQAAEAVPAGTKGNARQVTPKATAKVAPKATPRATPKVASGTAAKAQPRGALAPSAQKAVESRVRIEDEPSHDLSPAELEVARAVHVGVMTCELGASVTVEPARREGFFLVGIHKGLRFRMHPIVSRTGAIRLEDPKRGAMWLQLGNKSMLLSQKQGKRLADECQSPSQVEVAAAMKKNPPPSLLEPVPPEAPASADTAVAPGAAHTAAAPAATDAAGSAAAADVAAVPAAPSVAATAADTVVNGDIAENATQ